MSAPFCYEVCMMLIDLTIPAEQCRSLMEEARKKENAIAVMGHIGTHLDTYEKTSIPLDYFRSNGVVFDVRGKDEVALADVDLSLVKDDSFVLFYTGRIEECAYGTKEYGKDHPQLSYEVIHALIEKHVRFIGVDCQGIRRHEEHTPADRLCEKNGVYVIENLMNLGKLLRKECIVYVMWQDDPEMTGLRCRVIAEIK